MKSGHYLSNLSFQPYQVEYSYDSCLISFPTQSPYKVPVVLRNETKHDIVLPLNCVIAELSVPQEITDTSPREQEETDSCHPQSASCTSQQQPVSHTSQQCSNEGANLKFDFGESQLSEEWKARITLILTSFLTTTLILAMQQKLSIASN